METPRNDDPDAGFERTSVPGERLVDMLYRNIRDYVIFSSEGASMGRIYPHVLSEKFHATATPIREALQRLAAEGFIENTPRRGFHVKRPTAAKVQDLWQVRAGLEVLAGELVIARLERGDLHESALDPLQDILERLADTVSQLEGREHIELSQKFHGLIVELGGNQLLLSMYRGIQVQLLAAWVRRGLETWRARVGAEADDHREILAALRTRDSARYGAIARQHVATSLSSALNDLQVAGHDAAAATITANPRDTRS